MLQERIEELKAQVKTYEEKIKSSIDPVELAEIKTRLEGLQVLTEEKDKRIEDLTREVETLNVFAHYFKNVDVKKLEAPAESQDDKKENVSWWKFWKK